MKNINELSAELYLKLEDVMHATRSKKVENYIRGMIDGVSMLQKKVLSEIERDNIKCEKANDRSI